jgi:hypothetical protein
MQMTFDKKSAPYAPPSNVIAIIRRFRERNLPEEIDVDLLLDVGISKGNVHRTLAALQFLGLIAEDGMPLSAFHSVQIATDEEYVNILQGLVQTAYNDVFQIVDPGKDSQAVIDNHFRRYQPTSQRSRMVTLFLALCREAGIPTLDAPRERSIRAGGAATARVARASVQRRAVSKASNAKSFDSPATMPSVQSYSVSNLRAAYIAALIEGVRQSAAKGQSPDIDLLNRIERLMAEEEQLTTTATIAAIPDEV